MARWRGRRLAHDTRNARRTQQLSNPCPANAGAHFVPGAPGAPVWPMDFIICFMAWLGAGRGVQRGSGLCVSALHSTSATHCRATS
jgi:hypothetical protein